MPRQAPFGNYFIVNPVERWAAVCVSKNANTGLKAAVLESIGRRVPTTVDEIHDAFGWVPSDILRPAELGPPPGYTSFVVWRDPVERWYSAVNYLRGRGQFRVRARMHGLGAVVELRRSLDGAVRVTRRMLDGDPLRCDEHFRRQVDHCDLREIEHVVPIRMLNPWMATHEYTVPRRLNVKERTLVRDIRIDYVVRSLYERDYAFNATRAAVG